MSKKILIKANVRTRVFRLFSSSIASTIRFNAEAGDDSDVTGKIEVDRWHWFMWKRETYALGSQNAVEKGFADADYLIHVTPDQDCTIIFERRQSGAMLRFVLLATVLIAVAAAAAVIFTMPPSNGSLGN